MIYDVIHVTRYHYRASVPFTRCILRLTPADRPGQRIMSSTLKIEPEPAERSDDRDFFGNHVTRVTVRAPHDSLVITAASRVERTASPLPTTRLAPRLTPSWTSLAATFADARDLGPAAPVQGLFASRLVPLLPEATSWAARSFPLGRPVLEGALDLNRRINTEFRYDPGSTDIATPLAKAFAARHGVCQDFAHVAIAGLRGLGLAARYVSGYLRTVPPPGKPRLEGVDATHAWIEVWCGSEVGWVGLDPTNGIPADENHIVLAIGRDYADVSPVDGVVLSSGPHELAVSVDVREVGDGAREPARQRAASASIRPA